MQAGNLDDADEHFRARQAINEELLRLAPDRPATLHGVAAVSDLLAQLAGIRKDWETAEHYRRVAASASRRLIEANPNHRLYEVRLVTTRDHADILVMCGNYLEAIAPLDEAVQIGSSLVSLEPKDLHFLQLYRDCLRAELAVGMRDQNSVGNKAELMGPSQKLRLKCFGSGIFRVVLAPMIASGEERFDMPQPALNAFGITAVQATAGQQTHLISAA